MAPVAKLGQQCHSRFESRHPPVKPMVVGPAGGQPRRRMCRSTSGGPSDPAEPEGIANPLGETNSYALRARRVLVPPEIVSCNIRRSPAEPSQEDGTRETEAQRIFARPLRREST